MKTTLLLITLALVAATADAEPLATAVAARMPVPAGLALARVYVPVALQAVDVAEADIAVEAPRVPQPGRASVRVTMGRAIDKHPARTVWVQVELIRATAIADTPAVAADAPTVTCGTKVTAVVRAGALVVRAPALLEAAARVGEVATIRITATHVVARGTLVAADTVEVAP
jgi:hypothetical protein